MRPTVRAAMAALAIALLPAAPAAADPWPGASRAGLTYGFDAGAGGMSVECIDGCGWAVDPSASLAVHVGAMLRPCMAILYDGWFMINRSSDTSFGTATVVHSLHTAGVQGWIVPRWWLRGGVGLANLNVRVRSLGTRSDTVPTLSGAAGFELISRADMAVDVSLRVGITLADQDEGQDESVRNIALAAGMSWY